MATEKLTEYERRRLENIRRNDEMMASLKIRSKLSELSTASKRQRAEKKTYKVSPEKNPKTENPIVMRRSLRCRGMPPDSAGLGHDFREPPENPVKPQFPDKPPARFLGPVSMKDAYRGGGSDDALIELISSRPPVVDCLNENEKRKENGRKEEMSNDLITDDDDACRLSVQFKPESIGVKGSVDLESFGLKPENVARVVPGRILAVRFFPTADMTVIVVGNKFGDVGFWNVDSKGENGDGIYLYHPHSEPVSGIVIPPFCIRKMYSCSYDGLVRLMDVEKEVFNLVYSSDHPIFSMSQPPRSTSCIYFGEGDGVLNMWDERMGKASGSWALHERRINSVDFNSLNTDLMATSSTDGTACIWDLRKMHAVKPKPKALMTVHHSKTVQSAHFSPSGTFLATTSPDNKVGVAGGANFEDISMIYHDNTTGRWISTFKAIWGWDDNYIYVGNMKRGVDVISSMEKRQIYTLQSPELSAIPCRFDAHADKVGMLASATSGGQIYLWTQQC